MKKPLNNINSLTGIRAFAAFWVLSFHTEYLFHLLPKPISEILISLGKSGYLGVDIFFVLSGFILSYRYSQKIGGSITVKKFLVHRLARIYPVHITTLLAYAILVNFIRYTGLGFTNDDFFFSLYNIPAFIKNLFLVHAWSFPIHLTWNMPSWSISTEWLGYLCFPLLVYGPLIGLTPPSSDGRLFRV